MHSTSQYVKPGTVTRLLGVTRLTLIRWAQQHKIKHIRLPSGHYLYDITDAADIQAGNVGPRASHQTETDRRTVSIAYARVSSSKQADDLERQVSSLKSRFPHHNIVTDISSAINWERRGLQTILDTAMRGTLKELVVMHRDRLARLAF